MGAGIIRKVRPVYQSSLRTETNDGTEKNKKRGSENLRPAFLNSYPRKGGKFSVSRVSRHTSSLFHNYFAHPQPAETAGAPQPQPDEAAGAADDPQPPADEPHPPADAPPAVASLHGLKVYGTNRGTIRQT